MSMSTKPRDLAAIKHALEPGTLLATLTIATIMIVRRHHDDARKTPDITPGNRSKVMGAGAHHCTLDVRWRAGIHGAG
jgi:hypothetical protein